MKIKQIYRAGCAYDRVLTDARKNGQKGITIKALRNTGHATADIDVVLSPKSKEQTRPNADCRGSFSARGEFYLFIRKTNKADEKVFIFQWRKEKMEPRTRPAKTPIVKAKKVESVTMAKAKAKAKK